MGWASDPIQRPGRKRFLVVKAVQTRVYSTAGQMQAPRLVEPAVQMPAHQRHSVSRRGPTTARTRSLAAMVDRKQEPRPASRAGRRLECQKLECRKHSASGPRLTAVRTLRPPAATAQRMDSLAGWALRRQHSLAPRMLELVPLQMPDSAAFPRRTLPSCRLVSSLADIYLSCWDVCCRHRR